MKQKDRIEILRAEVEIPEVVQKKAEEAFARIREEQEMGEFVRKQEEGEFTRIKGEGKENMGWKKDVNRNANRAENRNRRGRSSGRRMWTAAAAAAVLTVCFAGAAAAYMQWSRGLEDGLQTTAEQRQKLEENQMASFVGQSVTQGDVTVTMQQCIVDNYFAHLSFRVDGYTVEDGVQPGFDEVTAEVESSGEFSGGWNASFYNGLIWGNDGSPIHAEDGTPFAGNDTINYTMADGSMEFQIDMQTNAKGSLINQPIHVELTDLGVFDEKAGITVEKEGNWTFDWVLQGSDEMTSYELNAPLGDTGATVVSAELSPISIALKYDFPKQEETELAEDENGETFMHTDYAEPPHFAGVRLKDGTIYVYLENGGTEGYCDTDTYQAIWALSRVIDVEQVESLLFIKSYWEGEPDLYTNLYEVPVL